MKQVLLENSQGRAPVDALIVEDDDMLNTVMTLQLTCAGISVRSARTGQEALRQIEERVPLVLILDVGLPDMTAFDIVEYLRKKQSISAPALVIHTNLDLSSEEQAKLKLGLTRFITKSTAYSDGLAELVFELVDEQRLGQRQT